MSTQIDQYVLTSQGVAVVYAPALTQWVHVVARAGGARGAPGTLGVGGGGGGGGGGLVERSWSVFGTSAFLLLVCGDEGGASIVRLFDLPYVRTAVAYAGQPGRSFVEGMGGGFGGGTYGDISDISDSLVFRSQGQSNGGNGASGNIQRGGGGGANGATSGFSFLSGGNAQGYLGGTDPFVGNRAGNGALVENIPLGLVRTSATPTIGQSRFGGGGGGSKDDVTPGFGAKGLAIVAYYRP